MRPTDIARRYSHYLDRQHIGHNHSRIGLK